jgi:hypothetical protein
VNGVIIVLSIALVAEFYDCCYTFPLDVIYASDVSFQDSFFGFVSRDFEEWVAM